MILYLVASNIIIIFLFPIAFPYYKALPNTCQKVTSATLAGNVDGDLIKSNL